MKSGDSENSLEKQKGNSPFFDAKNQELTAEVQGLRKEIKILKKQNLELQVSKSQILPES